MNKGDGKLKNNIGDELQQENDLISNKCLKDISGQQVVIKDMNDGSDGTKGTITNILGDGTVKLLLDDDTTKTVERSNLTFITSFYDELD